MFANQIKQQSILRVLIAGFTLVILLWLTAAFNGLHNIYVIKENAASLVAQEMATTNLIQEVQSEQAALNAVFHRMVRDPESIDREKILAELDDTDQHINRIVASVSGKPREALWRSLEASITAFSAEARRLLSLESIPTGLSRRMIRHHQEVLSMVAAIIRSNDQEVIDAQQQIAQHSAELIRRSAILFGACLLLAIVCSALTVRVTTELFRRMEWQTGELSRVSWHMLENQETTARRFSHELHDELGQSLTAVKANLAALDTDNAAGNGVSKSRLDDCLHLVKEAIGNVRQLSQLLRPTILDDFGLDAALRWLCERFTQRTGIEVEYESNFSGRLSDETETHLFRISQEALTNVARHSGATHVTVELNARPGTPPNEERIRLTISDNGHGLSAGNGRSAAAARRGGLEDPDTERQGMGMIGMRARARGAGGELALRSEPGQGLSIEIDLPAKRTGRRGVLNQAH